MPEGTTDTAGGTTTATSATVTDAATTTAAFDWKGAGVGEADIPLVTDRGWKNPGDVLTSYRNLEKLTGVPPEQIVKLPKTAEDKEGWRAVHTKMGCPEKPDGYALPRRATDKDGNFEKLVGPWLHEVGISKSQAHGIVTKWNEYLDGRIKADEEAHEAATKQEMTALKGPEAWGDKFDANSAIVDRAAEAFGMTAEHLAGLKKTMGYGATMRLLFNIGSKVAVEGSEFIEGGGGKPGFGGMSPESARAEIARLRVDKTFTGMFNSTTDLRGRQEAREKMRKLEAMAYPGTSAL